MYIKIHINFKALWSYFGVFRVGTVSFSFLLPMIINCDANYISDSGYSIKIVQQAFYELLLLILTFGKMLPPFYRQKLVLIKFSFFANHRAAMYDDCLILITAAATTTPSWNKLSVSKMLWDLSLKSKVELSFILYLKKNLTETKIDRNNAWTIGIFGVSLLVK